MNANRPATLPLPRLTNPMPSACRSVPRLETDLMPGPLGRLILSGSIRRWSAAAALLVLLTGGTLRAETEYFDNVSVSGALEVFYDINLYNGQFNLGVWNGGYVGSSLIFQSGATPAAPSTSLWYAANPLHQWVWEHDAGSGQPIALKLDPTHQLLLYPNTAGATLPAITLNPTGTSTFGPSVTFNGTDNLMPNQTLTGSGSVLNVNLADGRYYLRSSSLAFGSGSVASGSQSVGIAGSAHSQYSSAIGGSDATGDSATAIGSATVVGGESTGLGGSSVQGSDSIASGASSVIGNYSSAFGSSSAAAEAATAFAQSQATGAFSTAFADSTATGDYATASGSATASGYGAIAVGSSTASGMFSVAMGESGATEYYATALGASAATGEGSSALGYSYAEGYIATALGSGWAKGDYSVSIGYGTYAQGNAQFALGQYNVKQGNSTQWIASDNLFILGNGTAENAPSNAMVVRKDAGAAIGTGVTSSQAAQVVVGKYNDTRTADAGTDHTQGVFVVGAGTGTGTGQQLNALRILADGTVLVGAHGDIPMGDFTAGTKP